MNILLFGKTGQVGWELQRALAPLGKVIALDVHTQEYCGDFSNPEGVAETVRRIKPDVIVNAAAIGAWLVHYSTDYVFPGDGVTPWSEDDATGPLNTYGETKLAGEVAVQKYCPKHLIFRTSWVYAGKGNNFAKTMLRLAKDREELSIINDQFGAPTGAELLADCTAHAIRTALSKPEVAGLYHLVASGSTTWFDYANLVFAEAKSNDFKLAIKKTLPVATSAYPTPARRPNNSRLDNRKFQDTFNLTLPSWDIGVKRMLAELFTPSGL
ncbi:dTDP-4-dehydrorhamnose reductase [Rahnella variigena]|uniref:dTDP-4-dehydrorhamnose reductase n=1 Tax=Rahnella variigena TaxID=574964 RepID=A0ABX9PWZ9_9GAMM|nr:dTDP-4-dehydrorhamnose reductase [Rahnella variigena]RJT52635.1 dTDP-4-dehydrorhamnose reductase [Rahnella variigena]RKF69168.1 dTDP-4-dehydrorhamnose reductase [Rahnella variigena]